MLHDALADFKSQIEPRKSRITLLEDLHNTERVQIMVETVIKPAHLPIELVLAGVSEGRVADIVG
jgi:hypothetical protein